MIECWFSEDGFVISGPKIDSVLNTVFEENLEAYTARWYVFNQLMDTLSKIDISDNEEIKIYHDSRLIEELKGELEPLDSFAKHSRSYFVIYDRRELPRISFYKVSNARIRTALEQTTQK